MAFSFSHSILLMATRPSENSVEERNKSRPRIRCDVQFCGLPPAGPPPYLLARSLWVFKCFQLVRSCSVQPMTAYTLPIIVVSWCVPKMNSEAKKKKKNMSRGLREREWEREKKKMHLFANQDQSPARQLMAPLLPLQTSRHNHVQLFPNCPPRAAQDKLPTWEIRQSGWH